MDRFRFSIPPILCKRIGIGNWLPNLDSDFSSEKRKSKREGYTTLIAIYITHETRGGSSKILIYFCGYWNCNLFLYVSNGPTSIATYFHRMAYAAITVLSSSFVNLLLHTRETTIIILAIYQFCYCLSHFVTKLFYFLVANYWNKILQNWTI